MFPNPTAERSTANVTENAPIVGDAEVNAQLLSAKTVKAPKAPKAPKDLNFVVAVNGAEVIKTLDILQAEEAVKNAKRAKQTPVITKGGKSINSSSFSSMCSVHRRKLKNT